MRLRLLPAGTFEMGSPATEPMREAQEQLHPVRLSRPFYLGRDRSDPGAMGARAGAVGRRPSQAASLRSPLPGGERELRRGAGVPAPLEREGRRPRSACLPRRSGSTPAARARRHRSPRAPSLTTDEANFHGGHPYAGRQGWALPRRPHPRRARFPRTPGASSTCTATSGSGARTGTARTATAAATDPIGRMRVEAAGHPRRQLGLRRGQCPVRSAVHPRGRRIEARASASGWPATRPSAGRSGASERQSATGPSVRTTSRTVQVRRDGRRGCELGDQRLLFPPRAAGRRRSDKWGSKGASPAPRKVSRACARVVSRRKVSGTRT